MALGTVTVLNGSPAIGWHGGRPYILVRLWRIHGWGRPVGHERFHREFYVATRAF